MFGDSLVSDVHVFEKFSREELSELFYSHTQALQFQFDFQKESQKAADAGLSWSGKKIMGVGYIYIMRAHVCLVIFINIKISFKFNDINYK